MRLSQRKWICATILFISYLAPDLALAGKLEGSLGGFQFSASNKRNNSSSSLSGFGSYHLAYHHAVGSNVEVDAGYSIIATDGIGGDLSFGFDIGIIYFPFSASSDLKVSGQGAHGVFQDVWRPFVGLGFHHRNFQSTSAQYAGAGLKLGTEYQYSEDLSFLGYLRYISLGGPNQSSATQVEALAGAIFRFW